MCPRPRTACSRSATSFGRRTSELIRSRQLLFDLVGLPGDGSEDLRNERAGQGVGEHAPLQSDHLPLADLLESKSPVNELRVVSQQGLGVLLGRRAAGRAETDERMP